jgi:cell filamentation protein, protein adenylyltransferase
MKSQYINSLITNRLEEKLSRLKSLRPLPKSAVKKLRDHLRFEMTYNSNAIEGNSFFHYPNSQNTLPILPNI